jgi:signal transduction histidine kinase
MTAAGLLPPSPTPSRVMTAAAPPRTPNPPMTTAAIAAAATTTVVAGMVLYSDEPRLIGETFTLEPLARSALLSPRTDADISDLRLPENRFERGDGKLLEVYRPVWTPDGQPLLFETYFRYDVVSQRSHQLWRAFAGIMLSCLVALVILLAGFGWLLLVRARRARAEREQLMSRALAASDSERRRIAATLHDGVVQQLVAASFMAAGQAQHAASGGDLGQADSLQSVAATVRTAWPACARCSSTSTRPACATPGWPARCSATRRSRCSGWQLRGWRTSRSRAGSASARAR